jgi:hypothetical protein
MDFSRRIHRRCFWYVITTDGLTLSADIRRGSFCSAIPSTSIPHSGVDNILRTDNSPRPCATTTRGVYPRALLFDFSTARIPYRHVYILCWRSVNDTTPECCAAKHVAYPSSVASTEPLETRFESLKDRFVDWRESLFATVEIWTAYINRWTTDYPALLVLRVLAGAMSLYLLVGIWISLEMP